MNAYDQNEIDQRFEAALQRCRDMKLFKLAGHYEKARGMQRIHAARFLESLFILREQNIHTRVRAYVVACSMFATTLLVYLIWRGMP